MDSERRPLLEENGQTTRSLLEKGQTTRKFVEENEQTTRTFVEENGKTTRTFSEENGKTTRAFVEENGQTTRTFVYKRRWWVLAVFCLANFTQSIVWNTWGPIAESAELVFGWTDGIVALLPNLGNISYLLLVIPGSIVVDTKGFRFSMVTSTVLLVFCTAIRCFTLEPTLFTSLAYISAFLQGITAIVSFAAPALMAAVWFPLEERPTATSIGSFFNYFGVTMSFIIGPQLVPGPVYVRLPMVNGTLNNTNEDFLYDVSNMEELKSGISSLMYTHVGMVVTQLALVLIYFPAKPALPPSITASIQRTDYKHALQKLLRNGPLWTIAIAGALPIGVSGMWIANIDVIIKSIGVSQVDAGWMGFFNTLIGSLSGIFIARYSSLFHRRRRMFLVALFTCSAGCIVWFSLICDSVVAYSLPSLYISCILIGILINGTTPLFYEMTAETSYPVGEGVTGGFYTCIHDVFGAIFLSSVSIPNIGITWLNWAVLGSLCMSIPLLCLFPERYKRSDIDMKFEHK